MLNSLVLGTVSFSHQKQFNSMPILKLLLKEIVQTLEVLYSIQYFNAVEIAWSLIRLNCERDFHESSSKTDFFFFYHIKITPVSKFHCGSCKLYFINLFITVIFVLDYYLHRSLWAFKLC